MKPTPLLKRIEKQGPFPHCSTLFLLTYAELLESIDKNWVNALQAEDGKRGYIPSNLNFPPCLPLRSRIEYEMDGPISEFGAFNAFILGEYMALQGFKPHT
uniref:Uncharacterized protein n=1 Tax=Acrobeloides nanus TaxID=290746 RepID=A0A914CZU0_9BILA